MHSFVRTEFIYLFVCLFTRSISFQHIYKFDYCISNYVMPDFNSKREQQWKKSVSYRLCSALHCNHTCACAWSRGHKNNNNNNKKFYDHLIESEMNTATVRSNSSFRRILLYTLIVLCFVFCCSWTISLNFTHTLTIRMALRKESILLNQFVFKTKIHIWIEYAWQCRLLFSIQFDQMKWQLISFNLNSIKKKRTHTLAYSVNTF